MRTINPRLFLVAFSPLILAAYLFSSPALAETLSVASQGHAWSGVGAPGLDLGDLARRLRRTEALGVFAKLALKDRLDTLMADFALFHGGHVDKSRSDLKARFDDLLKDTVTMLRKGDPALSAMIEAAHRGLWTAVSDPITFAVVGERASGADRDGFVPGAES